MANGLRGEGKLTDAQWTVWHFMTNVAAPYKEFSVSQPVNRFFLQKFLFKTYFSIYIVSRKLRVDSWVK